MRPQLLSASSGGLALISAEADAGIGAGSAPNQGQAGPALARATGTGSASGGLADMAVNASASSLRSVLSVQTAVHASLPGTTSSPATSIVDSRTSYAHPAPASSLADGLQAASFATAAPSSSDLKSREAGNSNVLVEIGTGSSVFGLMTLGATYSTNGSGASASYKSTATFHVNITSADPLPFKVGLLNPVVTGSGFDTLTLTVSDGDKVLENDMFTDASQAIAFFSDHVLSFKNVNGAQGDFTFALTLTAHSTGDGFRSDIVAAVPEPSVTFLLVLALIGLVLGARRRAAA